MRQPDPTSAPEHLVRQLALTTQPPLRPHPTRSPEEQQAAHLAQCRAWADRIWSEGFVAGATLAAAWTPSPRYSIPFRYAAGIVEGEQP